MLKLNPTTGNYEAWQPGPDDGGDVVGRNPAGWYPVDDPPKPAQKTPAERIAKLERLIKYQQAELRLAEQEGRVPPGPSSWRSRYEETISRLTDQMATIQSTQPEPPTGKDSEGHPDGGGSGAGRDGGHWVTINGAHVLIEGK